MASGNADALTTGENIIIAGLVIQLFFFSLFVYTSLSFLLRLRRRSDGGSSSKLLDPNPPCRWQRHMYALYTGNGLILVRSLFRLNRVRAGERRVFCLARSTSISLMRCSWSWLW
ncbi:hypothetical protein BDW68DRAFT_175951 [Aspergillus falconensis]